MVTERSFGEIHFGAARLGNKARTRRLVMLADQLTRHPSGTLPQKLRDPAALQATYRLMNCDEVTHATVLAPHREETLSRIAQHAGPLLVICDGTELDYTTITSLRHLGQIGNGTKGRRGYICQNCLVVDPCTRQALGLTNQLLHIRDEAPAGETKEQSRRRKSRESRLWPDGTRDLPGDRRLIVVCDRGGDTFEELEHEHRSGRRFVIRSRHNRRVLTGHEGSGRKQYLESTLQRQPAAGTYTLEVAATSSREARTAKLSVSFLAARLVPPKQKRGEYGDEPLPVWAIRVWEPHPPQGAERLEWVLLTNEPTVSFEDAWRVIEWYECRWVVEEYHKALKTGCNIEDLQFCDESRLEPMIALLSVVALTLLNLRDASRRADAKITPAHTLVAQEYVDVLSLWRHKEVRTHWSLHDFFQALARLGGHQNRKHDKPPGWLILWRGWTTLQLLAIGARAERRRRKLG
jgi:Transposase DNA-binding/Transposase DDE domain